MSESDKPGLQYSAESQKDRWIKYGGNVVLTSVVVIALAVLVVYLFERRPKRLDTTASGMYSLKPQTLKIIRDNPKRIKIISLYSRSKPPAAPDEDSGYDRDGEGRR